MPKISFRLFLIYFIPLLSLCGGGSDVGNPDITGMVYFENGKAAQGAMVILGRDGAGISPVNQYVQGNGMIIHIKACKFDTVFSDPRGRFTIEAVEPGKYVLVVSKDSWLGFERIEHTSYGETDVNVMLENAADFKIRSNSISNDSRISFVAAQIAGTNYVKTPDSAGTFSFYSVPSGDLDLILYKSDSSSEILRHFVVDTTCGAVLIADPTRSTDYWTLEDCNPLGYQEIPYVKWSSPANLSSGKDALVNIGQPYDIHIQFSHPMDTRLTSQALKAFSSDGKISLDTLWWRGDGEVFIAFCSKDSSGICTRKADYFEKGVKYSLVVNTTAQSAAGVKIASPDTIRFIPEP